MSGAFWVTLGHVEVLIRNAMHQQLTAWSTRTYREPRWYLDPGRVLACWTCPATGAWIGSRCQVLTVLQARPWTMRASHAPPQRRGQHRPARR